jgi:hypothetical protein
MAEILSLALPMKSGRNAFSSWVYVRPPGDNLHLRNLRNPFSSEAIQGLKKRPSLKCGAYNNAGSADTTLVRHAVSSKVGGLKVHDEKRTSEAARIRMIGEREHDLEGEVAFVLV